MTDVQYYGLTTTYSNNKTQLVEHGGSKTLPFYVALIVADLWILISLIHYGIKTGKWRQIHRSRPEKFNSGLIYTSVVVCAGLCLMHHGLITLFCRYIYYENDTYLCNFFSDLIKCIYGFVIFTSNVFTWLRQRVFYTDATLKVRFGKVSNTFSFLTIFMIFFGGTIGLTLLVFPDDSVSSPIGCVYRQDQNFNLYSFYVTSAIITFGQVSLVCLLLHALLNIQRNLNKRKCLQLMCCSKHYIDAVEKQVVKSDMNEKAIAMTQMVMRKTIAFAILSLALDTLTMVLSLRLKRPNERNDHASVLACTAVFVNLLFMILSFVPWKEMITSPCRTTTKKTNF